MCAVLCEITQRLEEFHDRRNGDSSSKPLNRKSFPLLEARVHSMWQLNASVVECVSRRLTRPNFVAEERAMAADQRKDWRKLCEAVVKETDPDRFMALVIELNNALDEKERRRNDVFPDGDALHDEQARMHRSSAAECAW
jgi:hypothetical protein